MRYAMDAGNDTRNIANVKKAMPTPNAKHFS